MVHSGIKRETIKMLFNKSPGNIVTVESICPPVGETTNASTQLFIATTCKTLHRH